MCFKTNRRTAVACTEVARIMGLSKSGAVHWMVDAMTHQMMNDSNHGIGVLLAMLPTERRGALQAHLDKLVLDEVPW